MEDDVGARQVGRVGGDVADVTGHDVGVEPVQDAARLGRRAHEGADVVALLVQLADEVPAEQAGGAGDEGAHEHSFPVYDRQS